MSVTYFGSEVIPLEESRELFRSRLIESPPPIISVDIETISLDDTTPIGFAIATSPNESWYFRVLPEHDAEVELVQPLLNNPAIKKVYHNAPFDLRILPLICEADDSNIADTNVMARLLGYQETNLQFLTATILNKFIHTVKDFLGPKQTTLSIPYDTISAMCASHARVTLGLYHEFIDKMDIPYYNVEMKVIPILVDMSLRGLKVVQADRARVEERLVTEMEYYKEICAEEDFNPGSTQQVGYTLAKRGNFLPFTKTKKNLKTDKETLKLCDDPLATVVLNYRKAQKLLSTYILPLADADRIYTNYNLDAVVGRISSSNRNLQNIPAADPNRPLLPEGCRFIFAPDSGMYTTGDYSQEHLYILMHMSGDRKMQSVYLEGEFGGDIHEFTAREMNIPRKLAKTINYAMLYGATERTIASHAEIKDIKRCSSLKDKWFAAFPDAAYWIKVAKEEGMRDGWSLPTLFGRRIKIPEEMNQWGRIDREGMERKCVNYPILGSDGEVMKRALIVCEREKLPLAVTVHDSITLDGNCIFPIEELESIAPVRIPFIIERTNRWT